MLFKYFNVSRKLGGQISAFGNSKLKSWHNYFCAKIRILEIEPTHLKLDIPNIHLFALQFWEH